MSETSRRFTDREVALVLRKASEMDDSDTSAAASGLSLEELTDIAGEVGISAEAIRKAVSGLNAPGRGLPSFAGAPLTRRAVHAVPAELDQDAIAALVRMIDERTHSAGAVTEALGSVRWTSSERFKSTRVSITPSKGGTSIEVVEQFVPRIRRIFQLLPAAWSVMLGVSIIAGEPSALGAAAVVGVALAAGAGAGRLAWTMVAARSDRRVKELAEGLAAEATLATSDYTPPPDPERRS